MELRHLEYFIAVADKVREEAPAIVARLRRYRDAGVTDLAARIVPLGNDPAARTQSRLRTQEFLASICPEL